MRTRIASAMLLVGFVACSCGKSGDSAKDPLGEAGGAAGAPPDTSSGGTGGSKTTNTTSSSGSGGGGGSSGKPSMPTGCETNSDCDDEKYCNGVELCDPESADANSNGCVAAATLPCSGEACDEDLNQCVSCATRGDVDGDGAPAPECAGDEAPDCDDNDGRRFPGNSEVCDSAGLDEDCDPDTLGGPDDRDLDDDGFVSNRCCNLQPDGELLCGNDCADDKSGINPGQVEDCNDGVDDDCDGIIDGEVVDGDLKQNFYLDTDLDGFGVTNTQQRGCYPPEVTGTEQWVNEFGDCQDDVTDNANAAAVHPAAEEVCDTNGVDEDCDYSINEGCTCVGNETQPCGPTNETGECRRGTQQCINGSFSEECTGSVIPRPEICNHRDDDCDGVEDNGVLTTYYEDKDQDGYGVTSASVQLCPEDRGTLADKGGDCEDDPQTNPLAQEIHPNAAEQCNGYDDNCDEQPVDFDKFGVDMRREYYRDQDLDGFGTSATTAKYCEDDQPSGWELPPDDADDEDCDDGNVNINPGELEVCNDEDDNCDDLVDNDGAEASCEISGNVSSAACAAGGVCVVAQCSGAYLDCNGGMDCEVNGATDVANCGACNNACYQKCLSSSCDEFTQIAGGNAHTCALTASGRVLCWGANGSGELGNGSTQQRLVPTATTITNADEVAVGWYTSCAVASSSVRCWGRHTYGELGTASIASGSGVYSTGPVVVSDLTAPEHVAVGQGHACAVHNSGRVACWGRNHQGQLGNEEFSNRETPVPVFAVGGGTQLTNAIAVSTGRNHSCAIIGANPSSTSGQVVCWGANNEGQLGDNVSNHGELFCASGDCSSRPVQVVGPPNNPQPLSNAVAISAGENHTCAVRNSGQVVCWGRNLEAQLGDGSTTQRSAFVNVTGLTGASLVVAKGSHSCAISSGKLACWGFGLYGQLGDGQTHSSCGLGDCSPSPIVLGAPLDSVSQVGAGVQHTCAIHDSGQAYCWGSELSGRLGNGTTNLHPTPFPVSREP